jgi:hypothetical protein
MTNVLIINPSEIVNWMIINARLMDTDTVELFTESERCKATFELIRAIIIEGYNPESNPIPIVNKLK